MENSPFEFYLTGSRFFGSACSDSDWDFFTERKSDLLDLENWLKSVGFICEANIDTDYNSTNILKIWKHGKGKEKIHVQVVENALLKVAVQNALLISGCWQEICQLSKKHRRTVWNIAYALFQAGKNEGQKTATSAVQTETP